MKRRDFITLIGGAAATWPLTTHAQQTSKPVVGFLNPRSAAKGEAVANAFREGLRDVGFEDGRNLDVEYRWAEDHYDRLPALATDLVTRGVAVIVAGGSAWVAAKSATRSIPIVFTSGLDPVLGGLVGSLNRPEANLTGASFYSAGVIVAKQIELLREVVPKAATVTMLVYPSGSSTEAQIKDAKAAADRNGVTLQVENVSNESDLDGAFADLKGDALLVAVDPFFDSRPDQIVARAARARMPAMYYIREFVQAGGLMSYGASITDAYRQAGRYAGRIVNGEKPADLPVLLPTRFELTINLKAANALGLVIPPTVLALADQVIE